MRHDGVGADVGPGEFFFVSTHKPLQAAMLGLGADGRCSVLFVKVPGPLLRQRVPGMDNCCNRPLDVKRGCGAIMRSLVDLALEEASFLTESESTRFADTLVNAISEATLQQIDRLGPAIACTRASSAARTLERAKAYIAAHLSDTGIDASTVADHCRVSIRYLHAVFAPTGTGVAGFIRERRLQQIQAALREERLRHRSITEIAGQWDFEDPAHFSRSYKQRFGRTPSEERRLY